ncbi:hypothetical protein [Lihuaxuella thermophila]|uniref:Uncharacterized protein n=1 Tax=Lihuaxuella thermophila TaxID=1173111 RepID=A0A1H8FGQ9_9BACL|nr:hypothetical protein [Lihuaxuella thermophila]SEN31031.1 hypothetical protein SAMN05444955_108195 [Lihuaxuella thermophila]
MGSLPCRDRYAVVKECALLPLPLLPASVEECIMTAIGVLSGKRFDIGEAVISEKAWNALEYSDLTRSSNTLKEMGENSVWSRNRKMTRQHSHL